MTEMDKDTLQNVAALEGMLLGQRLVLAMLVHAARTAKPFDLVRQEVGSECRESDVQPDAYALVDRWSGGPAGIRGVGISR